MKESGRERGPTDFAGNRATMRERQKFLAWLWVGLCILAIFCVVPTARTIQKFVSSRWGRSAFGYAVLAAVAASFLALLFVLASRRKIRSPMNYIWLTATAITYAFFTLRLWRNPEEAVHFLEYGLLGYLLFRALRHSIRDESIYLAAFLIGALVGVFDEILQWAMPNRYWDFRDAGLNALAAGLVQVGIWKGIRPAGLSPKIPPRSWRRVSLLIAANLLLLGLCASNTPKRVSWYAKRLPLLSFLAREEPMSEFTRRHEDPEIGVFFSRLTVSRLLQEDAEKAEEYGEILRRWKDRSYADFLSQHHPLLHAFLYEMRVRVFRRDRWLEKSETARTDRARKRALQIAFRENQILEKYFGRTLETSSYRWEEEQRAKIAARADPASPYRSPVSAGPFQVKESVLWLGILIILAGLAGWNTGLTRRADKKREPARGIEPPTR